MRLLEFTANEPLYGSREGGGVRFSIVCRRPRANMF